MRSKGAGAAFNFELERLWANSFLVTAVALIFMDSSQTFQSIGEIGAGYVVFSMIFKAAIEIWKPLYKMYRLVFSSDTPDLTAEKPDLFIFLTWTFGVLGCLVPRYIAH